MIYKQLFMLWFNSQSKTLLSMIIILGNDLELYMEMEMFCFSTVIFNFSQVFLSLHPRHYCMRTVTCKNQRFKVNFMRSIYNAISYFQGLSEKQIIGKMLWVQIVVLI